MASRDPNTVTENLLAWGGVTMHLPATWELSGYDTDRRNLTRLEIEDDYARRAVIEWRPIPKGDYRAGMRRQLDRHIDKSTVRESVDTGQPGWDAELHRAENGDRLAIVHGILGARLLVVVRLYFAADNTEAPGPLIRQLISGLTLQHGPTHTWIVYDMEVSVPACYRLAGTSFEAGRKMLAFQWRFRRLLVWQFSLAHLLLRDKAPAPWCAAFLNRYPGLRGHHHYVEGDRLRARRARLHPFGHAEDIGRWCFRHHAGYALDEDADRLRLWSFSYRRPADLAALPAAFR